jgi:hypothetical protein
MEEKIEKIQEIIKTKKLSEEELEKEIIKPLWGENPSDNEEDTESDSGHELLGLKRNNGNTHEPLREPADDERLQDRLVDPNLRDTDHINSTQNSETSEPEREPVLRLRKRSRPYHYSRHDSQRETEGSEEDD